MTLLEKLQNDALAARKAAMKKEEGGEHAVLLATVAADAAMIAKSDRANPSRPVTDADVVSALKKHIAGIDTTLAEMIKRDRPKANSRATTSSAGAWRATSRSSCRAAI
uniref:Uncharacterized protein n=1 Tax=Caulobacter phage BL57 TaxID=3348355 RepID=A0AB74UGW3_9VIRU